MSVKLDIEQVDGLTLQNIQNWNDAYSWGTHIGKYITVDTSQNNLSGDKTTSGKWIFNNQVVVSTGWLKGQDDGAYSNHAIRIGGNYRDEMVFYEYGALWRFVKSVNGVNTDIIRFSQGAASFNNPGVSGARIDTSSANGGFTFNDPGGDNIIQLRPYSLYLAHGDYGNVNFTLEDNLPMFKYGNYVSQGGQVFLPASGSSVMRTLAVGATNGSSTAYANINGVIDISSLYGGGDNGSVWNMMSTQTNAIGYQDIEISLTNALTGTIVVELTSSWYGSPGFGLIRLEGGFGLGTSSVWNSDLRVTFASEPLRSYYKIDSNIIYNATTGKHYIRIHKRLNSDMKFKAMVKIIDSGALPLSGVSVAFGNFVSNSTSSSTIPNYGFETGQGPNYVNHDFSIEGSVRLKLNTSGLLLDGYSNNGYYSEGYTTAFTISIEENYLGMYNEDSATGYALYKNTKGYSTLMIPDSITTPRTIPVGINQNGVDKYANSDGIISLTTSVSNTTFTNNSQNSTTQNQTVTLTNTSFPRIERVYYGATTNGTLTINKYAPVDGDEIIVHGKQCSIVIKSSTSNSHAIYSADQLDPIYTLRLSEQSMTGTIRQFVHLRYMANYMAWVVLSASLR